MNISYKELLKIVDYLSNKNPKRKCCDFELELEISDKLSYIIEKLDEFTNNNRNIY